MTEEEKALVVELNDNLIKLAECERASQFGGVFISKALYARRAREIQRQLGIPLLPLTN